MSDPVISPDGKWIWTGTEWIPAPPGSNNASLSLQDSLITNNMNITQTNTSEQTNYSGVANQNNNTNQLIVSDQATLETDAILEGWTLAKQIVVFATLSVLVLIIGVVIFIISESWISIAITIAISFTLLIWPFAYTASKYETKWWKKRVSNWESIKPYHGESKNPFVELAKFILFFIFVIATGIWRISRI